MISMLRADEISIRSWIELHTNPDNIVESIGLSIPLYIDGKSVWRQDNGSAGKIGNRK